MEPAPVTTSGPRTSTVAYRSWLPRLTSRVMVDLRIWMLGFGFLTGVAFPFAVVPLGVPHDVAIRPAFFAATILAGLLVGAINTALVQIVIGVRLRALAGSIRRVEGSLRDPTLMGDWSSCDPASCRIPVDSADELGESAESLSPTRRSTPPRPPDGIAASSRRYEGCRAGHHSSFVASGPRTAGITNCRRSRLFDSRKRQLIAARVPRTSSRAVR